ncbi:MAG: putative metal-binding motif-containing protein, partial [Myxococcota bacterium]|nr:putative metal-binding motif-containing protein [Myxococcota bacterium]
MLKRLLIPLLVCTGCKNSWKLVENDGDSATVFDGDCWPGNEDPVPPEGALDYGLTKEGIYPGALDLPYDGIDANCDGKDDFDYDEDGFVPKQFEGIRTLGYAGELLQATDCWDDPEIIIVSDGVRDFEIGGADIYPDADEQYYDGIDQNCDGKNDFDQDEDGFVPEIFDGIATLQEGEIAASGSETAGGGEGVDIEVSLPATDCWDDPGAVSGPEGAEESSLTGADIHPDATDLWYDGIDQDCAGDDDFDQDVDGFVPTQYVGIVTIRERQELDFLGSSENVLNVGNLPGNDCWDDPNSIAIDGDLEDYGIAGIDVNPDAVEQYYDGIDQNCDTLNDFDQDTDGYVFPQYDGVETIDEAGTVSGSVDALSGDCWDHLDAFQTGDLQTGVLDNTLTGAEINPDATEQWYDGVDQNCNGDHDFDRDGDLYARVENKATHQEMLNGVAQAITPSTTMTAGVDCWDAPGLITVPSGAQELFVAGDDVNPGATDQWYDGIDQDCAGDDDFDQDVDTFANEVYSGIGTIQEDVIENAGASVVVTQQTGTDCNDDINDDGAEVYPGATELCDGRDNDCDGAFPSDETDDDADEHVECTLHVGGWDGPLTTMLGDDCDDAEILIHPDAFEYCDGLKNDCNTASLDTDEIDDDNDGYVECVIGSVGWQTDPIKLGGDCNDADPTEDADTIWYSDVDGDGFGDVNNAFACERNALTDVEDNQDCNDADDTVYPNAPELCDGQVNNVAFSTTSSTCGAALANNEADVDEDDYVACTIDSGGWDGAVNIINGDDCDDSDGTEYPGVIWYSDVDDDGFGDPNSSFSCARNNIGDELNARDCNDNDNTVYPEAPKLCDGQVNDVDADATVDTCEVLLSANDPDEVDDDGDGYVECAIDGGGWDGVSISGGDDCDDTSTGVATFPGAAESESLTRCMKDTDDDGYGDSTSSSVYQEGTDCDDSATANDIYPGAPEVVDDGIDQDCDSGDTCYVDADDDGYRTIDTTQTVSSVDLDCVDSGEAQSTDPNTDCDDSVGADDIYPGAPEVVGDSIDQNCDAVDDCYQDLDD